MFGSQKKPIKKTESFGGGEKLNKKIFGILAFVLVFSLMLTPFAIAKPGAEKKNNKFEFFELVCSGSTNGNFDRFWYTPPNADPLDNKTQHSRGGGWTTGNVVELTIGEETFTMDTSPYNVTWTTTFNTNLIRNNDGTNKLTIIQLTDVVTVYDADNETIGTLVLNLKSAIDFSTMPPGYSGTMQGYGTGDFRGVKISGIDIGLVDPVNGIFMRNGTITGWPVEISND
jgi:hypothetical protein